MHWLRAAVLVSCCLPAVSSPVAEAREIFKDEAGRVQYIIDDDGMVSMYENSATDITLSVKRAPREAMYPHVDEVVPGTVTAGDSITLTLRGENLVGARITLGAPGIEVGESIGAPGNVQTSLRIPADFPSGDVAIVISTPVGKTFSALRVSALSSHAASSNGKKQNTARVATEAPVNCPAGMLGVAAERGGFCIDLDMTFSGDLKKAEKACSMAGKRLCAESEWRIACAEFQRGRLALKNMIGEWEWTASTFNLYGKGGLHSVLLGKSDCDSQRLYTPWRSESISGRCCQ